MRLFQDGLCNGTHCPFMNRSAFVGLLSWVPWEQADIIMVINIKKSVFFITRSSSTPIAGEHAI